MTVSRVNLFRAVHEVVFAIETLHSARRTINNECIIVYHAASQSRRLVYRYLSVRTTLLGVSLNDIGPLSAKLPQRAIRTYRRYQSCAEELL